MANGGPRTRPRPARNGSLYGLGHGFGTKMRPRPRRGHRPNLLGAGGGPVGTRQPHPHRRPRQARGAATSRDSADSMCLPASG